MHNIILILIFSLSLLTSQESTFEKGVEYYNNRAENTIGIIPDDSNILEAISIFESLLNSENDLDAALYLVRSYYYIAQYVLQDYQDRKLYFELAKDLSDKYIDKYPDSPGMLYWNLANMSNWAKLVGLRAISKLGGAEEYRERAVDLIIMDPDYEDGGGFFLLGAVYYTAPNIPVFLPWPDAEKSIAYFRKAVNTGDATPLQVIYLVKALLHGEYLEEAEDILIELIKAKPRPDNHIEDLHYIIEGKEIWNEYFKAVNTVHEDE